MFSDSKAVCRYFKCLKTSNYFRKSSTYFENISWRNLGGCNGIFFIFFFPFFWKKKGFENQRPLVCYCSGRASRLKFRSSAARRQPCFSSAGELDANLRLPAVGVSKCIRHPRWNARNRATFLSSASTKITERMADAEGRAFCALTP